ncbi:peptidoglycan-binding protein [Phormidium tenue FACHB-886]|nr:peptidoglycan-binding protein [Phormidium tenue FACHB-886]
MPVQNGLECLIGQFSVTQWGVLKTYYALSIKPELTEIEADCLEEILEKAETDNGLNFLLNEIDYLIGQKLGLQDEDHVNSYRDQKAYLREHLVILQPEELDYQRELQKWLKERGHYRGPVDGVAGKDFCEAVKAFQRSSQLEPDGIVGPKTLLKLITNHEDLCNLMPNEADLRRIGLESCLENCNPPPGGDHA